MEKELFNILKKIYQNQLIIQKKITAIQCAIQELPIATIQLENGKINIDECRSKLHYEEYVDYNAIIDSINEEKEIIENDFEIFNLNDFGDNNLSTDK